MKIAKKAMKKQFDKKKRNPQESKVGDNVQLEAKNIHSNRKYIDLLGFQKILVKEYFNQSF